MGPEDHRWSKKTTWLHVSREACTQRADCPGCEFVLAARVQRRGTRRNDLPRRQVRVSKRDHSGPDLHRARAPGQQPHSRFSRPLRSQRDEPATCWLVTVADVKVTPKAGGLGRGSVGNGTSRSSKHQWDSREPSAIYMVPLYRRPRDAAGCQPVSPRGRRPRPRQPLSAKTGRHSAPIPLAQIIWLMIIFIRQADIVLTRWHMTQGIDPARVDRQTAHREDPGLCYYRADYPPTCTPEEIRNGLRSAVSQHHVPPSAAESGIWRELF